MRYPGPLLLISFVIASCGEPAPAPLPDPAVPSEAAEEGTEDPLMKFRQLTGQWMDNTTSKRFQCYEQWKAEGDSVLNGFGFVMAKGDTVFIEDLKLEVVDGTVVYSARIDSQNNGAWVPFTAQPSGPDSLVFENPGHDFPQCITYVKDSSGTWHVAVTGNENGTERAERFHFRKREEGTRL